jgi:hypothetical protein
MLLPPLPGDPVSLRERAHREAMRADIPSIAGRLQETLGQRMSAFAIGVKDPRSIGKYARGDQVPRDDTAQRLRHLYEITLVLLARETPETVRAWMLGSHPLLEDRSPVELLHEDDQDPVGRTASAEARTGFQSVVSAAEEFSRAV